MKKAITVSLVGLAGAALLGACGGSTGGGTGGHAASGSTSSSSSSGTGGSTAVTVNGCSAATAEDHTGSTTLTIAFDATLTYDPACTRVKAGTMVTFSGFFPSHPLAGGDAPPTVDTTSPIKETNTGSTATFTLATAGTYGFFCEEHFGVGMKGAIFVE